MKTPPSKPTVLVVEDEGLVALHLKECLGDLGFSADVYTEGEPALEALRGNANDYTAAVLDLGLPDMQGDRIVQALLAHDAQFRIVLTTGHDTNEVMKRFAGASRIRVLGKPYDGAMLEHELARLGVVPRAACTPQLMPA
jgi:DNA-binding response OmpR family regulator